jgi:hypothetical protein
LFEFKADENIYHHVKHLIEQLSSRIIKESESKPNGSVTNEQFADMLRKHLPMKTADDINELLAAANREQPNDEHIALVRLFSLVNHK